MPDRPLDELRSLVGASKRTVEGLLIEAGKVDEFATAIRDDNPAYRSADAAREQGFRGIPAPMIHTMCALFERYQVNGGPLYAFDFGMDQRYKVLGEQYYEYGRVATVGDVLDGVTTVTDVSQREGSGDRTMTFATTETEYTDEDDEHVQTVGRTVIETRDPTEGDGGEA